MTWVFLALAIAAEVTATLALRASEGFTKLVPSIVLVVGYLGAFAMLSFALERGRRIGIALIIGGVLALELGGAH